MQQLRVESSGKRSKKLGWEDFDNQRQVEWKYNQVTDKLPDDSGLKSSTS